MGSMFPLMRVSDFQKKLGIILRTNNKTCNFYRSVVLKTTLCYLKNKAE